MDGARRAARSERTSRAIGRRLAADAVASAMATPARASTQVWQNAEPSEPPEPRPAAALLPMAPSLLGGRMQPLRNVLSSGFVRGNATHTPLRARGLRREKFPRPPLWGSPASVVASEKGRSGGSSAQGGGRRSRGAATGGGCGSGGRWGVAKRAGAGAGASDPAAAAEGGPLARWRSSGRTTSTHYTTTCACTHVCAPRGRPGTRARRAVVVVASVCARARGCVFEAKRHTPSLSLALLPQRSCGGPAAAEGGVDVGAAAEKAGAEARVRRLQPQPRVRRRRAGGGGGLKCGRRATAERRARSARASFVAAQESSHREWFLHCPAYAIVPVWFARFAVRARPELGVASEAKTPGSAVTNRGPLHGLRHCTGLGRRG